MNLVKSTSADSWDLFYGLFKYNSNSIDTIWKMKAAFDDVERGLREMERSDTNGPGGAGSSTLLSSDNGARVRARRKETKQTMS
jgi:hypothetical protein